MSVFYKHIIFSLSNYLIISNSRGVFCRFCLTHFFMIIIFLFVFYCQLIFSCFCHYLRKTCFFSRVYPQNICFVFICFLFSYIPWILLAKNHFYVSWLCRNSWTPWQIKIQELDRPGVSEFSGRICFPFRVQVEGCKLACHLPVLVGRLLL